MTERWERAGWVFLPSGPVPLVLFKLPLGEGLCRAPRHAVVVAVPPRQAVD